MNFTRIFQVLLLFFQPYLTYSNDLADSKFYLIDSLTTSNLEPNDRTRLDSCLTIWHNSNHDTSKLNALNYWIGESSTSKLWVQYVELFNSEVNEAINRHEEDSVVLKHLQTLSASALHNLGYYWDGKDYDKSLEYYFQSLEKKKLLGDQKKIAITLNNIGFVYSRLGNIDKQLEYYNESLAIREEIQDSAGVASTLNNLASAYKRQGNIPKALECYFKSLKISEQIGYDKMANRVYNNIGLLYEKQGELEKALEFHQKSLALSEKLEYKYGISTNLNNIGLVFKKKGNYQAALDYYSRSLEMLESLGVKHHRIAVANRLNNIGIIHYQLKEYSQALEYHFRALKLTEEVNNKKGIATSLRHTASSYMGQQNPKEAEMFAKRSLQISQEIGHVRGIRFASKILYKVYKEKKDDGSALEMYELYTLMRDSVVKEENVREMLVYQYRYDYEKQALADSLEFARKEAVKDLEIEKQQIVVSRQKLALASVGGGLLLILILAVSIYRGKKRSDELLLNILPAETAEELKTNGRAAAKQFDQVTVLFTDFKGFTQMAEKLTPHELVAEIDECFRAFDEIMVRYSIEKIKTIGDAYMAAGGLPSNSTNDPADVVSAALEIRNWMLEHKKEKGEGSFEVRIGIHTGPVVAGIVGIKKFAYDIWGDTVNTAARMESSGQPGKVNISDTTFDLVHPYFDCEYRGKVEAKGKGMVKMYFAENWES